MEKGKTNKEVSKFFNVPPNTLSTWKKNKDKIFDAFRQGNLAKRVKVDIIAEISGHDAVDTEEESDEEEVSDYVTKPSFNDAMDAITLLENYSLFTKFGADLMKALEDINRVVDIDSQSNKRQSIITDFFA